MIYELRTYTVRPGQVPEFEQRFAAGLPDREEFSKLGAFWHSEIGPLNQVLHLWPYEDLAHRTAVRAAAVKSGKWPPKTAELTVSQESLILIPAPFKPTLPSGEFGPVYEMRMYRFQTHTMPTVLERWAEAIPYREKLSPLVGCWYTDIGTLNLFIHLWAYKDMSERQRIRGESAKLPQWPPRTREFLVSQENKILLPASFSPLR